MTPDQYCQERAAPRGSTAYYALLFAPPAQRQAATAILAFGREVSEVVSECTDPDVARAKLEWWRQELERAYAGQPQHPVTRALATHLTHHHLAREQFAEIADGAEMDLDQAEYPSYRELGLYCHRMAGVVWTLVAEVLGYSDRQTLRYAQNLGMGVQMTDLIGSLRDDARRGHVRLPADEMGELGLTRQALHEPETSLPLRALVTVQARRAREHFRRAREQLPEVDRERQRPGLILAAIYEVTLDAMERDGFHVLERRVILTPVRRLWIALATAWGEHRRAASRRGKRGGSG